MEPVFNIVQYRNISIGPGPLKRMAILGSKLSKSLTMECQNNGTYAVCIDGISYYKNEHKQYI